MLDLVAGIDRDTGRLVALATAADPATPVPSCGEWTLADLTWHLAEVQDFWAWIVERRATSPDGYEQPPRPADADLPAALDERRRRLVEVLRASDPSEACWSWSSDQTVGFTFRRQAHEALVHRVDGELATGSPSAIDAALAADGVAEVLVTFLGDLPAWATFTPSSEVVLLSATDVGSSWASRFGRMTGTSPASGTTYDLEALAPEPVTTEAACEVRGTAADLDLWLWGRRDLDRLDVRGDPALAARLRAVVVDATQ